MRRHLILAHTICVVLRHAIEQMAHAWWCITELTSGMVDAAVCALTRWSFSAGKIVASLKRGGAASRSPTRAYAAARESENRWA
jgi:hypothetical protein